MTEHKYTDEEIIKALECCCSTSLVNCNKCTYAKPAIDDYCANILMRDALDLINRQKAEVAYWMDEAVNAKKEAVKAFGERLKERLIEGGIYPVLVKNSINDLVKEMTEDKT